MDTQTLADIGLTQGEIKVYLAMLELGQASAGEILEKADVQNSVFHFCVNSLIKKGLVSFVKKNNNRRYKAADPESLVSYVKDKEANIKALLPELKAKQSFAAQSQEAEVFEGTKGVMTMLNLLIQDAKKGDEYMFFAGEADSFEETVEIQKFYGMYDLKRKEKGLVVKGIGSQRLKDILSARTHMKMKYTDQPIPANAGICNDKMVLISWDEKPTGILIRSPMIVNKQRKFFNSYWESIKNK